MAMPQAGRAHARQVPRTDARSPVAPKGSAMFNRLIAVFALIVLAGPAAAQSALRVALDGPISGATAPYVLAADSGLFAAEGLEVEIRPTRSGLDAMGRVSLGTYAAAVVDFPTFAEFLSMSAGSPLITALVIHDRPAFAVVGLKSHGIAAVGDLAGHTMGYDSDSLIKNRVLNLANANGMKLADIGFVHRDPGALAAALAAGEVDAIVAQSYEVLPDLDRLGVSPDDLTVLHMADNGLVLFGQVLVLNTEFARSHSSAVPKLLAAVIKGWQAAIENPDAAIAAIVARDATLDAALESERLRMIVAENVLTPFVLENGMGVGTQARQEWNVAQLQDNPALIASEDRSQFFNTDYLPSAKVRAMK
jgi:NitT/TauT family transport system substrate-binding protein